MRLKARKKPIAVNVFKFTGDAIAAIEWSGEMATNTGNYKTYVYFQCNDSQLYIHTLEGPMQVPVGNFIVQGVEGEYYSVEPNIFEKTFDVVEE